MKKNVHKLLTPRKTRGVVLLFLLNLLTLISISCSKDSVADETRVSLTITPFIQNFDTDDAKKASSITKGGRRLLKATKRVMQSRSTMHGIPVLLTVDEEEWADSAGETRKIPYSPNHELRANGANTTANNQMIAIDTRYHFIIERERDNFRHAAWNVGGSTYSTLAFDAYEAYRWFAHSFNRPDLRESPSLFLTTETIPNAKTDLLYSSGRIVLQPGNNYINFNFRRLSSAFQIRFNTSGRANTQLENISISNEFAAQLQTGTLDIESGTISSRQDRKETLSDSDWSSPGGNAPQLYEATFHTLGIVPFDDFAIRINRMHILDKTNPAATKEITDKLITFPGKIVPEAGKRYTFTVNLL